MAMKPSVLPRRGRSSASRASSAQRILRAAKRLFASRGYENTSTVAIAPPGRHQ